MTNDRCAVTGGSSERSMAVAQLVSALSSLEPYDTSMIQLPKHRKKIYGYSVGCYICGKNHVTLYKDGDKRICKECRG